MVKSVWASRWTAPWVSASERDYRPDVDGLRAIAVLPVLGFHAFPQIFPGGFVGVDVFFVISGFLISRIIFSELAANTFDLKDFYGRRVRRIFPALIVVLVVTLAISWWLLFPAELMRVGRQTVASALFVANFYFWFQSGYFSPDANTYPLLHLWSLGVEEQFYIFWPLSLLALWKYRPRLVGPAIVVLGLASFALNIALLDHRVAVFYFPMTRAWELMLGAALAWPNFNKTVYVFAWPKVAPEVITGLGLTLIGAAVATFNDSAGYPGWLALVPTIGAALLLTSGGSSRLGSMILGSRVLVFTGLISYPLYLWHWPMLWLARLYNPAISTFGIIGVCAGSLTLAWITYAALERPVRRKYRERPTFVAASLVSATAVAGVVGILYSVSGLPGRWSKDLLHLLNVKAGNEQFLEQFRFGKCFLYPGQGPKDFAKECVSDSVASSGRMVLWGDSSATALYPGLHALNHGRYSIAMFTSSACPPLMADYNYLSERPLCPAINDYILQHIRSTHPEIVVLSTAPNYKANIPQQLRATILTLREIGIRTVVVVGPPPIWPFSLPEYILRNYLNSSLKEIPRRLELPNAEYLSISRIDSQLREVAAATNSIYVSAVHRLCINQFCTVTINGTPAAWDTFHLTLEGSILIGRDIYGSLSNEPTRRE